MTVTPTRVRFLGAALACITALSVPSAPPAHTQAAVVIVALGASNTEGWGLPPSVSYPARLQVLLRAKGIDATVHNFGIAGDTTAGMLARLQNGMQAGTRLVILQPGTNDERMGLAADRARNIEAMRGWLTARNIKLILIENAVLDALPRSELRPDGVHFTPAGYAILAERLLPEVLAALGM